jgi:hypothetical protein
MKPDEAKAIFSTILTAAMLDEALKDAETKADTETPEIDGDKIRKQSEDLGNSYYHVYLGYKDAGFTDEQAFKLLIETIRRN